MSDEQPRKPNLFQAGECGLQRSPGGITGYKQVKRKKYRYNVAKILHDIEIWKENKDGGKELVQTGYNPFITLAHLAVLAKSEFVRLQAASELSQYVAPKLRSIEFKTDNENPFSVTINLGKAPENQGNQSPITINQESEQ